LRDVGVAPRTQGEPGHNKAVAERSHFGDWESQNVSRARRHSDRWLNELPLRDGADALSVGWCELTTTNAAGEVLYRNAWASSEAVTRDNVIALVAAGRSRWKIENENNNTLKTKGYHFEHNYGHGKQHLAALLASLILLAFLAHTVLGLLDPRYQAVRRHLPSRQTFFEHLRALTQYLLFASWDHLFDFMLEALEPARPPPRRRSRGTRR
jgi:hypothetical protein